MRIPESWIQKERLPSEQKRKGLTVQACYGLFLHLRCVLATEDAAIIKQDTGREIFNKKTDFKETRKLLKHDSETLI